MAYPCRGNQGIYKLETKRWLCCLQPSMHRRTAVAHTEPTKASQDLITPLNIFLACCHLYSNGVDKGETKGVKPPPPVFEVDPI